MSSNRGPNAGLIGRRARELSTPCLAVDKGQMLANIERMAARAKAAGKGVRPHAKGNKSSVVCRAQIEAGAIGISCVTLKEAETMVAAGLPGVLVTSPIVVPCMIARLADTLAKADDLLVVVDNGDNAKALDAAIAGTGKVLGVLIDIDVGQKRTGVRTSHAAVSLARQIDDLPHLSYRGVQAYYGHLQGVTAYQERLAKARDQWAHIATLTDALGEVGFASEIISGGGTGTHHIDLADGPFTEIQPGSYVFMDRQYGGVEIDPGGDEPFPASLSILAHVVSTNQPDRATINAGFKAMATDSGPPDFLAGAPANSDYAFMGDEHGCVLYTSPTSLELRLGDLVRLRAPHCDPTVNLHDALHVFDGHQLVDVWPIDARGY